MTSSDLARSYLFKARVRLEALALLRDRGANSDVVREAQELVELALKGMLRAVGVEPPKIHDVGPLLVEHASLFEPTVRPDLSHAAAASLRLRRDRELAFYGDLDFIPTEQYTESDAQLAYDDAARVVALATRVIDPLRP